MSHWDAGRDGLAGCVVVASSEYERGARLRELLHDHRGGQAAPEGELFFPEGGVLGGGEQGVAEPSAFEVSRGGGSGRDSGERAGERDGGEVRADDS